MYQNIYVRDWDRPWMHERGNVMENQETGERYRIIESSIEDLLNGE